MHRVVLAEDLQSSLLKDWVRRWSLLKVTRSRILS
jgi:hypothetical protein